MIGNVVFADERARAAMLELVDAVRAVVTRSDPLAKRGMIRPSQSNLLRLDAAFDELARICLR